MGRCSRPRMGYRQAARLRSCPRDHIGDALERRILPHQQDIRRRGEQRDRREILEGVVGNFRVQERIGGVAAGDDDQRVAVGRRLHQRLRGNHPAGAGAVLDHHRLAPLPGDHVAQRTGQDIDAAAGGVWHVNVHGLCGKCRLGRRDAAAGKHRRATAAIRNHRPMVSSRFSCLLSHAGACRASPRGADHGKVRGMLTIPPVASSFGTQRPRHRTKSSRDKGERDGSRGAETSPKRLRMRLRAGTGSCCKRSSATTSGWCPTFPTAC